MSVFRQPSHPFQASQPAGPILEVEHLKKVFPLRSWNPLAPKLGVQAVEDTTFALTPGRATALVGESGSGKTTVARLLARLYDPSAGSIRFRGQPIPLGGSSAALRAYRRHV